MMKKIVWIAIAGAVGTLAHNGLGIAAFLPELDSLMDGGLVTLEKAETITYRHSDKKKP